MGSSSTVRAVGVILNRFTNGVPSNSLIVCRNGLLKSSRELLSSASSISSSNSILHQVNTNSNEHQLRSISTFPPLCMGRRSTKIADRKVSFVLHLKCPHFYKFKKSFFQRKKWFSEQMIVVVWFRCHLFDENPDGRQIQL